MPGRQAGSAPPTSADTTSTSTARPLATLLVALTAATATAAPIRDCGDTFGLVGNVTRARFSPAHPERSAAVLSGVISNPWNARLGLDSVVSWEVVIEDGEGQVRRRFRGTTRLGAGDAVPLHLTWDGRDDGGTLLPTGAYGARFEARSVTAAQVLPAYRDALFGDGAASAPLDLDRDELAATASAWSDSPFTDRLTLRLDDAERVEAIRRFESDRASRLRPGGRGPNQPHEPSRYWHWYGNPHSHSTRSDGGGTATDGGCAPATGSCGFSTARVDRAYPYHLYRIAADSGCRRHPATDPFLPDGEYVGGELDWLIVTEHNAFLDDAAWDGPSCAQPRDRRNPGQREVDIYREGRADADAATSETFVGIYGMEWGTTTDPCSCAFDACETRSCDPTCSVALGGGHVNVYDAPALMGWECDEFDVFTPKCRYASAGGLFDVAARPPSLSPASGKPHLALCHPAAGQFDDYALTRHAGNVRGVAVFGGPATSCAVDFPAGGAWSYVDVYVTLLDAGWRVGPEGHQDNHGDNVGSHSGLRTVLLAEALTRKCLLDAHYERRMYATEDRNAQLIFTATPRATGVGHQLGEEIGGAGGVDLHASWSDPDRADIVTYAILRGRVGGGCRTLSCLNTVAEYTGIPGDPQVLDGFDDRAAGTFFYLVYVEQQVGASMVRTLSAPVWVDYGVADDGSVPPSCCAGPPPRIAPLLGVKDATATEITWSWPAAAGADGGYRVRSVTVKRDLPPASGAARACATFLPQRTGCADPRGLQPAAAPLLFYQVVGICADGSDGAS